MCLGGEIGERGTMVEWDKRGGEDGGKVLGVKCRGIRFCLAWGEK